MSSGLAFILGLLLGGLLVWLWLRRGQGEILRGSLARARRAKQTQKEEIKQKILESLRQNKRITNDEVQELTGVSDATATNYLEQLQQEGKIIQHGQTGRGVFYTLPKKRLK